MSLKPASFVLYALMSFVTNGQDASHSQLTPIKTSSGLQFFMDTTPDGAYCGHLYCWTDISTTSYNIHSIFGIAVYDVTKYSMSVKIASMSLFGPDICVRESEVASINATGNVFNHSAELILAIRDTTSCVNGSFLCELEFANVNGNPDVIRETVSSGSSGNCYKVMKELIDKEDLVTERELAELRNQTVTLRTEVLRLQEIVNISRDINQVACFKGVPHKDSRALSIMWGKVVVLCDTQTDGGGWILIQRRTTGDVEFNRTWSDYKNGFGTHYADFWIGNEIIHNLTSQVGGSKIVDTQI